MIKIALKWNKKFLELGQLRKQTSADTTGLLTQCPRIWIGAMPISTPIQTVRASLKKRKNHFNFRVGLRARFKY